MTLEQARKAVQNDYPQQEIGLGFEYEGAWYFLVGKGENGGFHAVDNKSGVVTGNLPIMILIHDEKFMKALKSASNAQKKPENFEITHDGLKTTWRDDNFLVHHGILGQRWGVRRFHDLNGRLTAEGKLRYSKQGTTNTKEGVFAEIYVATAAAALVAMATMEAVEHHNEKLGDKLLDKKGIADTSKTFTNNNPPKKIEGDHTAEDDMAKVNEAYGGLRPQTLNNCSMCSITMELRRRGFDVCARTSSEPVYTKEQLANGFIPKPKSDNVIWESKPKNYDKMSLKEQNDTYIEAKKKGEIVSSFKGVAKNILKIYPEGARGVFTTVNPFIMIGHAMAFEVKGGKVVIYDCQSNEKFDLSSPPLGFTQSFAASSSLTYRLDNKTINWDGMNDICAERKRK